MKARFILILTLMISTAICQDETDRNQERGAVTDADRIGFGVIFGFVFGIIFVVCTIRIGFGVIVGFVFGIIFVVARDYYL